MDLIEIDSFNPFLVRQFFWQSLAIMVGLPYDIVSIFFLFLYLFAEIVYLLELEVLLELVFLEMTVDTWKSTL